MDKYRRLVSNTLIFGIGTFSSKVLVFLLMPLYTRILTNADFGIADLIIQTANLIIPIASIGIANAVIRFGLDKSAKKSDVFSTGLITIIAGFLIFLLVWPLLQQVKFISDYTVLIYVFVFMSSLRSLCSQFVRANQQVKLYALDGLLSTIMVIVFNILFLVIFRMGIVGYVLAIVISDFLSSVFLFISARLFNYVKFQGIDKKVATSMIKYSVPLIPTVVLWWITNVSSRYIVGYMVGSDSNGLYAVSYKIPTIIILVSSIFIEAWQMSAVIEEENREAFFTKVFEAYQAIVFLAASGLIAFSKIITVILVSKSFYPSWQYIPFLVMSTTFSCFVTFLGSVYMVEKKSVVSLVTALVGAIINVILNLLLIPIVGVNGAAFAMFASYFIVFVLRAKSTQKFIKIRFNSLKIGINLLIILSQSLIMISEIKYFYIFEAALFVIILIINIKPVVLSAKKIITKII